jgi:hypothetical protein
MSYFERQKYCVSNVARQTNWVQILKFLAGNRHCRALAVVLHCIGTRLPSPSSPPCATSPRRAGTPPVFFPSRRRSSSLPPSSACLSMAWIWMVLAAGAVLLWAISLGRILSYPSPSCVPLSPQFVPPLRGDRRSRNVLLVVAHPDDESMYVSSPCVLDAQLPCVWNVCLVLV